MKTLVCLFTLIVLVFTACNQGQQRFKPVMEEGVADNTSVKPVMEEDVADNTPVKPDYTEITVENATNLIPGEHYRFKPTAVSVYGIVGDDSIINILQWENIVPIALNRPVVVPEGSPKVDVFFKMVPHIYYTSIDGIKVIEYVHLDPSTWNEREEIAVQIIEKQNEEKGRKGDIVVAYKAMFTGNLTRPDVKVEPYIRE